MTKIITYNSIKKTLLGILTLFTISCSEKSSVDIIGEGKRIVVDVEQNKEDIELSEFFSPEFMVLETSKEALIGEVDKVNITDTKIYVLDSDVTNSLFIFNRDGSFFRKISNKGRGPGEYLELDDFEVDEENKEIHLYCGDQKRILIYNLAGKFKRMIKLADFGYTFNLFPNGKYLTMSTKNLRNVSFWNENGERTTFHNQKDNLFWYPSMSISKYNNTCLINFPFYGDIYEVEDEKLIRKFYIDFQSKKLSMASIKDSEVLQSLLSSGAYASLGAFAFLNDILCFDYVFEGRVTSALYLCEIDEFIHSNLFKVDGIPFRISGNCNDGIILSNNASYILEYGERILKDDFCFPEYYHVLSENSNPVIILLKEKK